MFFSSSIEVYDFAFAQCFVAFIFVAVWIGTWQNLDTLFDEIIFNENKYRSSIASLLTGAIASILIIVSQVQLRNFAKNGGL